MVSDRQQYNYRIHSGWPVSLFCRHFVLLGVMLDEHNDIADERCTETMSGTEQTKEAVS